VIDASEGHAEERFRTIDRELAAYGAGLEERPQAVVLNKVDLVREPPSLRLDDSRIAGTFTVSAATGEGIDELKRWLFSAIPPVAETPPEEVPLPDFLEYRPRPPARRAFRVLRTDRGYRVVGTPPAGEELEAALRAAGVRKGAEVEIGDEVLEWQ
jgi:predicted GTPase